MAPPDHRRRHRAPAHRGRAVAVAGLALVVALAPSACSNDAKPDAGRSATAATSTTAPRPVPDGPNVVMIVLDDLDAVTMPYWDAMPRTRKRLADRGVVFSNAFVSSPECCPSRASFLTGNYPHNTRIYDSTPPDGGYQTFATNGAEEDTVATRLQGAGYHTAFVGKYLNGYEQDDGAVPPGWDEWFGVGKGFSAGYDYEVNHNGKVESFGSDPQDYLTDVLTRRAVAEVTAGEKDDDRPFFLALWTSAPHDAIPPAPRDADNPFARAELPRGANFDEPDVSDKPTWLRDGQRRLTPRDLDELETRYRKMMGSLYAVDDMVDKLLSTLEAEGELDDTVIVFSSDNGYNFGAHRLPHKMAPYEESIRVPLVVAGPGIEPGTDDHLVLNNDVTPTLLDLAGLPTDDLDGRSLLPLLARDGTPWRDDFLLQYHGTYHPLNTVETFDDVLRVLPGRTAMPATERPLAFVPTFRAVRTENRLYVEWYRGDRHEYELYDLETDPNQLANLVATPDGARAHQAETTALQARLEELGACKAATCRS